MNSTGEETQRIPVCGGPVHSLHYCHHHYQLRIFNIIFTIINYYCALRKIPELSVPDSRAIS